MLESKTYSLASLYVLCTIYVICLCNMSKKTKFVKSLYNPPNPQPHNPQPSSPHSHSESWKHTTARFCVDNCALWNLQRYHGSPNPSYGFGKRSDKWHEMLDSPGKDTRTIQREVAVLPVTQGQSPAQWAFCCSRGATSVYVWCSALALILHLIQSKISLPKNLNKFSTHTETSKSKLSPPLLLPNLCPLPPDPSISIRSHSHIITSWD